MKKMSWSERFSFMMEWFFGYFQFFFMLFNWEFRMYCFRFISFGIRTFLCSPYFLVEDYREHRFELLKWIRQESKVVA